jgi:hypothetical protein
MKKFLAFNLLLLLICTCLFAWQVVLNNGTAEPLRRADIKPHFDHAVQWLDRNYTVVENIDNPILWWMIGQAAQNTADVTLTRIYNTYISNHQHNRAPGLWTPMFDELYRPRVPDILMLDYMHPYQQFFVYSLSCDHNLEIEPVIQAQMRPGFCGMHYLHPRCITHQLMGLRFMQRYECGNDELVADTIAQLQAEVRSELFWDFRVGDAYIQRVTMLMDTGAYDWVKPVWLRRILEAQNSNGSWDDLYPLIPLPDGRYLGLSSTKPVIGDETPNFHTTAQATWLLSMLLEQLPKVK